MLFGIGTTGGIDADRLFTENRTVHEERPAAAFIQESEVTPNLFCEDGGPLIQFMVKSVTTGSRAFLRIKQECTCL